jgi:hypothetical protein
MRGIIKKIIDIKGKKLVFGKIITKKMLLQIDWCSGIETMIPEIQ